MIISDSVGWKNKKQANTSSAACDQRQRQNAVELGHAEDRTLPLLVTRRECQQVAPQQITRYTCVRVCKQDKKKTMIKITF